MINEVSINNGFGVNQSTATSARRSAEQRDAVKENANAAEKRQGIAAAGTAIPLSDTKSAGEQLQEAAEKMRDFALNMDRNLEFNVDKDSGRMVIKVIDPETEEVVRQIPHEDALSIAKSLEKGLGFLLETKA